MAVLIWSTFNTRGLKLHNTNFKFARENHNSRLFIIALLPLLETAEQKEALRIPSWKPIFCFIKAEFFILITVPVRKKCLVKILTI